jgi:hypothetical protein
VRTYRQIFSGYFSASKREACFHGLVTVDCHITQSVKSSEQIFGTEVGDSKEKDRKDMIRANNGETGGCARIDGTRGGKELM